jgi:hypothetical protein
MPDKRRGGRENVRDTELQDKSDEEIMKGARDRNLSPEQRRRFVREEKARGLRNKRKRLW